MKKLYFLVLTVFALTFSVNAQELINDGAFDAFDGLMGGRGENTWGMWSDDGGTVVVTTNVAIATPGNANEAEPWHLQLEQWGPAIKNGVTYVIKFSAYSDADRIIQLTLEDPANGYAQLGTSGDITSLSGRSKWGVPITTDMAEYTLTTTVDAIKNNSTIKFAFLLGTTTDVVYIDNVSMMEGGAVTSAAINKVASLNVYPNPASSTISVNSMEAFNSIRILNLAGQESMRVYNASGNIDVVGLRTGIYFVELMKDNNTIARCKFIKN
jgi:hypothetical protein